MEKIIKDGIKYSEFFYDSETDYEKLIFHNIQHVFGDDCILLDKHILRTLSGEGSKPDAYIIDVKKQKLYILEIELSKHDAYQHIHVQLTKIVNGLKNPSTKNDLIKRIEQNVKEDATRLTIFNKHKISEIFKFITTIVNKEPEIIVIIEKRTSQIDEIVENYKSPIRVLLFRVFVRNKECLCDKILLVESVFSAEKERTPDIIESISVVESPLTVKVKIPKSYIDWGGIPFTKDIRKFITDPIQKESPYLLKYKDNEYTCYESGGRIYIKGGEKLYNNNNIIADNILVIKINVEQKTIEILDVIRNSI